MVTRLQNADNQLEAATPAVETSKPNLILNQRGALRALIELAARREQVETQIVRKRATRDADADREYRSQAKAIADRHLAKTEQSRRADEDRRKAIAEAAVKGEAAAKDEFARAGKRIAAGFDQLRDNAKTDDQQARWEAATVFEVGEKQSGANFAAETDRIARAGTILGELRARLDLLMHEFRKFGLDDVPAATASLPAKLDDPIGNLFDRLIQTEPDLIFFEQLAIPRSMKGRGDVGIFLLIFGVLVFPLGLTLGWTTGLIVDAVVTLVAGLGLRSWLYSVATRQVTRSYGPLQQSLADSGALLAYCRNWAEERQAVRRQELTTRRDQELERAKQVLAKTIERGEAHRDEQLRQANEVYARTMAETRARQRDDHRAAVEEYDRLRQEIHDRHAAEVRELEERYRTVKEAIASRYETAREDLSTRWREGVGQALATFEKVEHAVNDSGPDWDDPAWETWRPPLEVPPVVRFGRVHLGLDQVPHGLAKHADLMEGLRTSLTSPALLAFPDHADLLIESSGEAGRKAALDALQGVMMRLLTSLPPGKVRFTLIDPVDLGRSFAAFMHLADFDEALVNTRVWTEPGQIEERLGDLTDHMEKVIQEYLRNEYETIEEYNAKAGEVAEPFRVLVIADFPVNFDEAAAKRLERIVTSGVRCGVLTLIAVDKERALPQGVSLGALRPHCVNLTWKDGALVWRDRDFGPFPLAIDPPPPAEFMTRVLQQVGAAAKLASRVEVPFEFIAPPPERWWTGDTRAGIDVALGKAGATKQQPLSLGKGTSQHVLVAGRTGSGKSTLLHALITNLALNFSPDEVELYLIDFKKGVEFKTYATHELPHARVVAIESEREFGISVLQRLDQELRDRADKYREVGVQDLNGYRNAGGTPPLPRVLLIVDEFQEFFVEDDKVAQEASLLLDRLVRQGRAFGVHVILGSQTLSGAYSLARSTLGQMAIRVALQCSEADAHLILSEDNSAARLLSRPGEAVYNDANGMVDGNHFFQVVWLPDDRREFYLTRVREMARDRYPDAIRAPIVFEGNVAARLEANTLLDQRLRDTTAPGSRTGQAWLGEAVAIKDPTAAVFRRQGGSHLLIVGQNEEAATGVMAASMLSLAAQFATPESDETRSGAKFYVLDGLPEETPLAGMLDKVAEALPHPVMIGGHRDVGRILGALAEELERRQQPDQPEGPELFLFIHDISRFRELRKKDDDFGFGRRDEAASPSDQLATILREGPISGLHVLTWCDSLNNVNRTFDRAALREFEQRVLFQMSPADSSHLIDSPFASKLGPHRAFLSSEEQGRLEKFRPYGIPTGDWLDWVRGQLRGREPAVEN